jgi:hypothetical protein
MPITPDAAPDPRHPATGDYRISFVIEVDPASDNEFLETIPVQVLIDPGSQGNTEAQMDQAAQAIVDHLATLPDLATGSLVAGKSTGNGFTITPTP